MIEDCLEQTWLDYHKDSVYLDTKKLIYLKYIIRNIFEIIDSLPE